jgi:hypothetical protein
VKQYVVAETRRSNAGGVLYNVFRWEGGRYVECESVPTHSEMVARRMCEAKERHQCDAEYAAAIRREDA